MSEEGCGCGGGDERAHGFLAWSAYRAYNELLREKIKKRFEAQEGPWMDQVAEQLVQLVNARWEGGRKGESQEREILEKLDQLWSQ
ncbi:MAG: hypothetical protein ACREC5_04665 [Thermoplasmata archaeon]